MRVLVRWVGWLILLYAPLSAGAAASASAGTRDFWVHTSSAPFRLLHADLRAVGSRSLVYVEQGAFAKSLPDGYLIHLMQQLEQTLPSGAFVTDQGLVSLEEAIFGPLPHVADDDRLIILFADLGKNGPEGFFYAPDQSREDPHSNIANIVYVNGWRNSELHTGGVIAHELELLLTQGISGVARESWLAESLADGAMLLTGYFGDQNHVDQYLRESGRYPLVATANGQSGPQLLFSSFLLDSLPAARGTAMGALSRLNLAGRDAVEALFQNLTGAPLNFDAIFSNYVSYVFDQSAAGGALPTAWHHNPAIRAPNVAPYFTYRAGSGELTGFVAPYAFVAIDLAQELSPAAEIHVERVESSSKEMPSDCARNASILWKPVHQTRIAVYAVGCNPTSPNEVVQFRLRILDQSSLPAPLSATLLR